MVRREDAALQAEDPRRFSGRPATSGSGSLNVATAAAAAAVPRPAAS